MPLPFRVTGYQLLVPLVIIGLLAAVAAVRADTTGTLRPSADGGSETGDWQHTGGSNCSATDCYTETDESSCDSDTTYIASATSGASQTFDIDESSIPDNVTITQIDITVCNRRVDPGAKLQTRRCVDGACSDSGTNINAGASYATDTQSYTGLSITKSANTDLEIGVTNTSDKGVRVSQIAAAVTYSTADITAPSAVTNLAASTATASAITLTWTSPGDDGSYGTAAAYDVRYSTGNITSGNFGNASAAAGKPTPAAASSSEAMTVDSLTPNTRYYFALKTSDEAGNESSLSNVANKYTLANPPAAAAFGTATATTIPTAWTANSNPAGTEYYAENQTANTNSGWITDTAWTASSLTAGTTYAFRVKARNADGTETDWVSLGSRATASAGSTTTVAEGTTTTISTSSTAASTSALAAPTPLPGASLPAATGPTIAAPTVAPPPDAAPIGAPGTTTPNTSAGETTTAVPILPTAGDTTPPTLAITKLPAVTGTTVSLSGEARESGPESGVIASLAYSYDGGASWHPVGTVEGLGKPRAVFSLTTPALPDSTFRLLVRARDNTGNDGRIESSKVTIDLLPVIFGGAVFISATGDTLPTANPVIIAGASLRFIASLEGGATHASLSAGDEEIPLTPDAMQRRFSSSLAPATVGTHSLRLQARDGADHTLAQDIGTLTVLPPLAIKDTDGHILPNAAVTLEIFDAGGRVWRRDTSPGQENPQAASTDGAVVLQVSQGTYRLRAAAPRHWQAVTHPVVLAGHAMFTGELKLPRRPWYQYLLPVRTRPVPLASENILAINAPQTIAVQSGAALIPHDLKQAERSLAEFAGHRLLITTLAGWNRASLEQLAALQRLQDEVGKDVTVIPWLVQQPGAVLAGLLQRGHYTLTGFADPAGTDSEPLGRTIFPSHFAFDRAGSPRAARAGFATVAELIELLGQIE